MTIQEEELKLIDNLEEKGEVEVKKYYSIKDKVANDFCDMFSSKNNASALRCFNHTLATQLKQGFITNTDDYDLYYIGKCVVYKGDIMFYSDVQLVHDNEENNKEEGTEVIINNVQ